MNKTELIEQLVPGIVKTQGKPPQVVRELLDNLTVSELTLMRDKQISSGIVIPGGLTGAEITQAEQAANKLLESRRQLDQIQRDRQEQALQVQAERQAREALTKQAQSRELEAQDRQTFETNAKYLNYSLAEANFQMLRELGPGFSAADIEQSISKMNLIPPTAIEAEQFRHELIKERERYLKSLDTETLRRVVREDGRTAAQRHPTSEQQSYQVRQAKEQLVGFDPMPLKAADGTVLNRDFFVRLSLHDVPRFRNFVRRYGFTQVTNRIQGVGE